MNQVGPYRVAGTLLLLYAPPLTKIAALQATAVTRVRRRNADRNIRRSADPDMLRRNILFTDDAHHRRLRHSVRDVFTRSFLDGLTEGIEAIAAETIDTLPAGVDFDFMNEIALPLPIAVAAAWLDLDLDARRLLREESPPISRMLNDFNDADTAEAGTAAFGVLLTEFLPLPKSRWRQMICAIRG